MYLKHCSVLSRGFMIKAYEHRENSLRGLISNWNHRLYQKGRERTRNEAMSSYIHGASFSFLFFSTHQALILCQARSHPSEFPGVLGGQDTIHRYCFECVCIGCFCEKSGPVVRSTNPCSNTVLEGMSDVKCASPVPPARRSTWDQVCADKMKHEHGRRGVGFYESIWSKFLGLLA